MVVNNVQDIERMLVFNGDTSIKIVESKLLKNKEIRKDQLAIQVKKIILFSIKRLLEESFGISVSADVTYAINEDTYKELSTYLWNVCYDISNIYVKYIDIDKDTLYLDIIIFNNNVYVNLKLLKGIVWKL